MDFVGYSVKQFSTCFKLDTSDVKVLLSDPVMEMVDGKPLWTLGLEVQPKSTEWKAFNFSLLFTYVNMAIVKVTVAETEVMQFITDELGFEEDEAEVAQQRLVNSFCYMLNEVVIGALLSEQYGYKYHVARSSDCFTGKYFDKDEALLSVLNEVRTELNWQAEPFVYHCTGSNEVEVYALHQNDDPEGKPVYSIIVTKRPDHDYIKILKNTADNKSAVVGLVVIETDLTAMKEVVKTVISAN